MVQPPWKTLWQFVKKLNIFLTYNPANALLGIDPNGAETYVHTKNAHGCLEQLILNCPKPEATKLSLSR